MQGSTLTSSPPAPLTSSATAPAVQSSGALITSSSVTRPRSGKICSPRMFRPASPHRVASSARAPGRSVSDARTRKNMRPLWRWRVARWMRPCFGHVNKPASQHGRRAPAWFSGAVDAVRAAFDAVPRAGFLPRAARRRRASTGRSDRSRPDELPTSHGRGDARLLEVRAGRPRPRRRLRLRRGRPPCWPSSPARRDRCVGVELVPELVRWGAENLPRTAYAWASVRQADRGRARLPGGRAVRPDPGVGATPPRCPHALVDQLAEDGRIVVPVARDDDSLGRDEPGDGTELPASPCTVAFPVRCPTLRLVKTFG